MRGHRWLAVLVCSAALWPGAWAAQPLLRGDGGSWLTGRSAAGTLDSGPLVTDVVAAGALAAAAGRFPSDPKNGTPWYRTETVEELASSNHRHFGALRPSGDFRGDALAAHAAVRGRAGLAALRWSEGLAALAGSLAGELAGDGCYIRHSPLDRRWNQSGFRYVGENLYKVINLEPSGLDVVDAWYAEIDDYQYGTVGSACTRGRCAGRPQPPCTLGHFTQVMWRATTDVGCALRRCPGVDPKTFIAVCHYGPGGNIVGELPFAAASAAALGLSAQACDGAGASALAAAEPRSSSWRCTCLGRWWTVAVLVAGLLWTWEP